MSIQNSNWQTLFLRNRHLLVLSIYPVNPKKPTSLSK